MKPLGWEVKRLRVPWDMVSLCSCLNVDHWEHYRYFRTSFSTNWYVVEYVFICGAWIPKDDDGVCPWSSSYSIVYHVVLKSVPFSFSTWGLQGCCFYPPKGLRSYWGQIQFTQWAKAMFWSLGTKTKKDHNVQVHLYYPWFHNHRNILFLLYLYGLLLFIV